MSAKALSIPEHPQYAAHARARVEFENERIREAVSGVRFGEVRLIIQDGVIIQIDRLEKLRLR